MKDPVVAETYLSDDGLHWLRALQGSAPGGGGKTYYLSRPPNPTRPNNSICETPEFLNLLARHDFIRMDFGGGDLTVTEQLQKLEGARVILAPHGAGLTNISYLNPPVRIIEVFGRRVISTSFIRIADALGLEHHAVVCDASAANGDMIVDCDLLERILS